MHFQNFGVLLVMKNRALLPQALYSDQVCLLLPAATQCTIDLHKRIQPVHLCLGQIELRP